MSEDFQFTVIFGEGVLEVNFQLYCLNLKSGNLKYEKGQIIVQLAVALDTSLVVKTPTKHIPLLFNLTKLRKKIKNYPTLDPTSPKPFYCIYKYGPCWSHAMTLACIRLHVVTNTTSLVGA